MSRTTVLSLEVLILLFIFVVTTPHKRCSVATMAWDRLVSVGRMLTISFVLARDENCTNPHLAHLIAGVKKPGLNVHDISLDMGAVERASGYHAFVQSPGPSLRAVALAAGRWSSSMVTRLRSAIVALSQSFAPASSSPRASYLVSGEPW